MWCFLARVIKNQISKIETYSARDKTGDNEHIHTYSSCRGKLSPAFLRPGKSKSSRGHFLLTNSDKNRNDSKQQWIYYSVGLLVGTSKQASKQGKLPLIIWIQSKIKSMHWGLFYITDQINYGLTTGHATCDIPIRLFYSNGITTTYFWYIIKSTTCVLVRRISQICKATVTSKKNIVGLLCSSTTLVAVRFAISNLFFLLE